MCSRKIFSDKLAELFLVYCKSFILTIEITQRSFYRKKLAVNIVVTYFFNELLTNKIG